MQNEKFRLLHTHNGPFHKDRVWSFHAPPLRDGGAGGHGVHHGHGGYVTHDGYAHGAFAPSLSVLLLKCFFSFSGFAMQSQ